MATWKDCSTISQSFSLKRNVKDNPSFNFTTSKLYFCPILSFFFSRIFKLLMMPFVMQPPFRTLTMLLFGLEDCRYFYTYILLILTMVDQIQNNGYIILLLIKMLWTLILFLPLPLPLITKNSPLKLILQFNVSVCSKVHAVLCIRIQSDPH